MAKLIGILEATAGVSLWSPENGGFKR